MWVNPDGDVSIAKTETDLGEAITTYRDQTGVYPALSECIERIPWRDRREGKLYEPLVASDGYDRTTDRPELVDWYARQTGALKHDQIARQIDFPPDAREYSSREAKIRRRLRNPVVNGERVPAEEIYDAVREYRGYLSQDSLEEQAETDCVQMGLGTGLYTLLDLSPEYHCYAEYRAIRRFSRKSEDEATAGVGGTLDAAIEDRDRQLAVEIKTGGRILQRHRAQATAQASLVYADPILIHLPLHGEAQVYRPETDDAWLPTWRYLDRIKGEAVTLSERL